MTPIRIKVTGKATARIVIRVALRCSGLPASFAAGEKIKQLKLIEHLQFANLIYFIYLFILFLFVCLFLFLRFSNLVIRVSLTKR